MRTKALLLAALPEPYEGPWVDISEAEEWRAIPRGSYDECVIVEVESPDGRCSQRLRVDRDEILIRGQRARGLIEAGINHGVVSVTLQLIEVR